MKKYAILSLIFILAGCSSVQKPPMTFEQKSNNISFFVNQATRIALFETKPSQEQIDCIKSFMIQALDLLKNQNSVDSSFESLREYVDQVPDEYEIFLLTVIDVTERYVRYSLSSIQGNEAIKLIAIALQSSIDAINAYEP